MELRTTTLPVRVNYSCQCGNIVLSRKDIVVRCECGRLMVDVESPKKELHVDAEPSEVTGEFCR